MLMIYVEIPQGNIMLCKNYQNARLSFPSQHSKDLKQEDPLQNFRVEGYPRDHLIKYSHCTDTGTPTKRGDMTVFETTDF